MEPVQLDQSAVRPVRCRLRSRWAVAATCASIALGGCGPQSGASQPPAPAPALQQAPGTVTLPAPAPVQSPPQTPAPAPVQQVQQPAPVSPAPVVQTQAPVRAAAPVARADIGQVSHIEPVVSEPSSSGAGAVLGGVLGGVLGHQVGDGTGRKVATVAGAVGGAFAGNAVERNRSKKIVGYRMEVQLDNGQTRSFTEPNTHDLRVGDRVRIVDGALRPA